MHEKTYEFHKRTVLRYDKHSKKTKSLDKTKGASL